MNGHVPNRHVRAFLSPATILADRLPFHLPRRWGDASRVCGDAVEEDDPREVPLTPANVQDNRFQEDTAAKLAAEGRDGVGHSLIDLGDDIPFLQPIPDEWGPLSQLGHLQLAFLRFQPDPEFL